MNKYEELVQEHGFVNGLVGTNEKCEHVIVTIDDECASFRTLQNNGWIRNNHYHKDGTSEETYQR